MGGDEVAILLQSQFLLGVGHHEHALPAEHLGVVKRGEIVGPDEQHDHAGKAVVAGFEAPGKPDLPVAFTGRRRVHAQRGGVVILVENKGSVIRDGGLHRALSRRRHPGAAGVVKCNRHENRIAEHAVAPQVIQTRDTRRMLPAVLQLHRYLVDLR